MFVSVLSIVLVDTKSQKLENHLDKNRFKIPLILGDLKVITITGSSDRQRW